MQNYQDFIIISGLTGGNPEKSALNRILSLRTLSHEETAQLIDVTEQIIEKPNKKQRQYLSKKNKTYFKNRNYSKI